VYPDHDGVITRLDVKPLASGVLEEMGWYASVGQSVVLPPRGFLSRLAYLVAVGETKDEVVRRLDEGEAALAIEIAGAGDPRGSRH